MDLPIKSAQETPIVPRDNGKTMTKKKLPFKDFDDTVSSSASVTSMHFGNQDINNEYIPKKKNTVTDSDLSRLYREIFATADQSEIVDQIIKVIQLHAKTKVDGLLGNAKIQQNVLEGQCERLAAAITRVRGGDTLIEKENIKDSSITDAQLNALIRCECDHKERLKKLLQKKDALDKEAEKDREKFEYCRSKGGEYKANKVKLNYYLDFLKENHARCKTACKQLKAESDAEIRNIQAQAEDRAQDMVTSMKLSELHLKDLKTQVAAVDNKIKEMTAILQDILAQNEDDSSDIDSKA
uniref:Transforming acidic coiled-coil-containing protein C-terminal domain-containing protein n=1 Tax=Strongyloides stercoralis TaxID=6248 RepID=A0A0K0DXV9_STRER